MAGQKNLRVLVVEDDRDSRELFDILLTLAGHEVQVAVDGPDGLERAHSYRPDVALIDLGLPRMDGCELARRLRAEMTHPPYLIAETSYGTPADRDSVAAAGFDLHLVKPIDPDHLLRCLQRVAS